jgi:hypothetical protein
MLADTGSVANILISEVFSFIWVLGFKFVKKRVSHVFISATFAFAIYFTVSYLTVSVTNIMIKLLIFHLEKLQ